MACSPDSFRMTIERPRVQSWCLAGSQGPGPGISAMDLVSGAWAGLKALGSVLDEIESEEGIKIHFTGPWQPYSFI
jgi:hypothetical protein